ncbi:hypothetical protein BOTBODRAFT_25838 [Botryobasidium botryosum FD-172 SS1]|uniref:Uncharacterized protein n=1 Tax=Botryobasidium botryosum (strain FD-172 SS1) TaxID=930990 RepID=A0A067N0N3_BOTB1|nr:hypothetical protein BOTBODRAFT_25838 [Botryobasidium botryosum FD-172 SS1]
MKAAQWILSLLPTQWHSPPTTSSSSTQITSIPLDISHLYNNIAAGPGASFDPFTQGRFPSEYLPTGAFHYDGIQFDLPTDWEGGEDNVIADSQVLDVRGTGFAREFHILYAGDWNDGESGARFRFGFEDGSEDAIEVSAKNWYRMPRS